MEKVKAGDSVVIKASTWNAFIDAANFAKENSRNSRGVGLRSGLDVGIVLVKNNESTPFGRFSAIVLYGICVTPEQNEEEFVSCPPVFKGVKMTEGIEGRPFAILLEPVEPGEIGRGMVLGVTPAKVTIEDEDHAYAVPVPGSSTGALKSSDTGVARIIWAAGKTGTHWCLLQLGGAGGGGGDEKTVMCRIGDGSAQTGYRVGVYNSATDTEPVYEGLMFLPDIALDAELPGGTWVIGHKAMVAATGGND